MKKENRKMAQQRRAKERRKKERHTEAQKSASHRHSRFWPSSSFAAAITLSCQSSSGDSESSETRQRKTRPPKIRETPQHTPRPSYSTDTALTVEDGDTVNIDYVGTVDGEEFSGGNTNGAGTDLVIGSGSYIDDFEDQLIGAHPGDTVEVTVTFPEDYGVEELNGKEAVFTVTVNGIYE